MTTLLAVAHGSRDPQSQEGVRALLALAQQQRPGLRAADAYVDNAAPSIRRALAELVADGERDVVVLPLLLTPASHSKTDIAASVQAGRAAHPGVRLRYGRPLGPHPVLVELLDSRLREAGGQPGDPVVLAAGGALDPDANAQVATTARLLWEGRDWASVDIAFASTTGPTVGEAVQRLARLGHARAAVARYFLGPGFLPRLVERQARSVGVEVVVSESLGPSAQLAGLLLERLDEAVLGDVRMNCDVCLYRTALPGHLDAVGAAQRPHTHPEDA